MSVMASQITGVSSVYSTVCSDAAQRKHEGSASLAFVRGIHRWPVNSPHKGSVTQKMFPFDDVIMRTKIVLYQTRTKQNKIWVLCKHFGLCFISCKYADRMITRLVKNQYIWLLKYQSNAFADEYLSLKFSKHLTIVRIWDRAIVNTAMFDLIYDVIKASRY